jgi:hypothetical protein
VNTPTSKTISGIGTEMILTTGTRNGSRSTDVAAISVNLYGNASLRPEIVLAFVTRDPRRGNEQATVKLSLTREKAVELVVALTALVDMPHEGGGR